MFTTTPLHLLLFHFHVFNESVKSGAADGELDARTGSIFAGVAGEGERGGWWVEEGSGEEGAAVGAHRGCGGCGLVVMNVAPVKKNSVSLPRRGRNKGGGGERKEMLWDGAEFSAAGQTLLPS